MSGFGNGERVDFTTDHVNRKLTGTVVDFEPNWDGSKVEYTVRVDTASGGGTLQTTADKMRRNTSGGGR